MKKIIALLLSILMVCSLAACASKQDTAAASETASTETAASSSEEKTLTMATNVAFPPYEFYENEKPAGIDVEIATAICEKLGYKLDIMDIEFGAILGAVSSGKADFTMAGLTVTDERKQSVDFSDAYAMAQLAILANADSGVASIDDLNQPGKKVAVKTGSTGDVYATKNLTNAEIVRLADESACVTEVVQGKADGFLYDQLTIYRNHQANPDTTEAVFIPFQDAEEWGIAVKKGNTELLDQLNAFIAQSKTDGEFDRLTEKYLSEEKKAFDQYGFKWFFDFE